MINKDLRQRHIEAFFRNLRGLKSSDLSSPEYAGAVVRSASESGIIDMPAADVDNMLPKDVIKLAREINAVLSEALTIDPL